MVLGLALAALVFLIAVILRSIANGRSPKRSVWREFGLGISRMVLFCATSIGRGIGEWQTHMDQQREHGRPRANSPSPNDSPEMPTRFPAPSNSPRGWPPAWRHRSGDGRRSPPRW